MDSLKRKINYLRISVTDLCNLRCKYCMPKEGLNKKTHSEILRNEDIEMIVRCAVKLGINKIRLTGGEPLVRKGIVDIVGRLGRIEDIKDLTMTTNGILLREMALPLKKAGLMRVNISLDSLDKDKYSIITRGGNLNDVLEGIEAARKVKLLPVKLNVVLIGGFNDKEIEDFARLTLKEEIDVRFIELMPIGEVAAWSKEHFLTIEAVLQKLPQLLPLNTDKGVTARYYRLPKGRGRIGLISPVSNHFCEDCNRIRITADGKLKPCLLNDVEINIKDYSSDNLTDFLLDGIKAKPDRHRLHLFSFAPVKRNMQKIGG